MTDTEILEDLIQIAAQPLCDDLSWGDESWRIAVQTMDGFWRGVILAAAQRRETKVPPC
jgi:hypothetical protein